jgi:hypothetical protein
VSDTELTVVERLIAVAADLPSIGKDARNQQQNFNYRTHDAVLDALNPLLDKHGVIFVPDVTERVTGSRTTSKGSTMYEVNLHVTYRIYGHAGDFIEASAWGEGTDLGDKSTNKAMTMAFKNVLGQVFAIATGEPDPDGLTPENTTRVEGPKVLSPPASWPKLEEMIGAYDQAFHDLFGEFVKAAARFTFGPEIDIKKLAASDKKLLLQKAAGAAVYIRENFEPSQLPPPGIEDIRGAFAMVVGEDLAIPEEQHQLDAEALAAAERDE